MNTPDNKRVIIPNAKLTGDNIINYSVTGTRRLEVSAGVSYGDDLDKVRGVLEGIVSDEARALSDPAPMIASSPTRQPGPTTELITVASGWTAASGWTGVPVGPGIVGVG